jgi:hypothetical protein
VWGEPAPTVKVWITMLLKADKDGQVLSTIPGLVRAAALKRPQVESALAVLLAPDADSRTPDNEGRRIEVIEGGWRILNSQKYRELRTKKQVADAERQRLWRETHGDSCDMSRPSQGVTAGHAPYADGDADADANGRDTKTTSSTAGDPFQEIVKLLGLTSRQLVPWKSILSGMTEGMGTVKMQAAAWPMLVEAAQELAAVIAKDGGEVTPSRYKAFVGKVLARQKANPRTPRTTDKASRGVAALAGWLNDSEITDAEVIEDGNE